MAAMEGRHPPGNTIVRMNSSCSLARSKLAVGDGDGLQPHAAPVGQQPGAGREELVVPPPVDRLDHLNRHRARRSGLRAPGSRRRAR